MNFADFHKSVRDTLRGSGLTKFVCTIQSVESHPGRVAVDWSLCISEPDPRIYFRGQNPHAVLTMLRERLRALRVADTIAPPPALADVGEPPEVA